MKHVRRGGAYFRVVDPSWGDPLDTTYSKRHGGRRNAAGSFGVLYLNATIEVAAARARRNFEDEIATLYDLAPEERPDLQVVQVAPSRFVDAVTDEGLRALGLPRTYPKNASRMRCQAVGGRAHKVGEKAIACRSDVTWLETGEGEELAVFDTGMSLVKRRARMRFARWYPTEVPSRKKARSR
ncbi:MAG TPA: RES domain-containing protein [Candidatus Tyrphobacter sp.]